LFSLSFTENETPGEALFMVKIEGYHLEAHMDKNFTIKSKQLACTLAGNPQNPPIIMLHGWCSHRGVWRQTMSALESKYYCVAVDLLGFGASDKPDGSDYSLSAQAQRVVMLADQLGFKTFSLLGHSMGGQIAMYIAAVLSPRRVEKLVTVGGVVTGKLSDAVERTSVPFFSYARKAPILYGLANSLIKSRPLAKSIFRSWFFVMDSIPFEDWEEDRLAALNRACAISADETSKAIHALDLTPHLRKIQAKTLLICGKQDGVVPEDQALLAQTLIPDNDLALIGKCGHFPMYERKSQYLKALALSFPI
jgi:pimeloyl-ACP methyl ester carboxylesterase